MEPSTGKKGRGLKRWCSDPDPPPKKKKGNDGLGSKKEQTLFQCGFAKVKTCSDGIKWRTQESKSKPRWQCPYCRQDFKNSAGMHGHIAAKHKTLRAEESHGQKHNILQFGEVPLQKMFVAVGGFLPSCVQGCGMLRTHHGYMFSGTVGWDELQKEKNNLHPALRRGQQKSTTRRTYSYREAREVLQWMDSTGADALSASNFFQIKGHASVTRWNRDRANVFRKASLEDKDELVGAKRHHMQSAALKAFEKKLSSWCRKRRQQGNKLGTWVLRMQLGKEKWKKRIQAHKLQGDARSRNFMASDAYLRLFLHRHGFKFVKATNYRSSDMATVLNAMQNWCGGLRSLVLKPENGSANDPKWGRFSPYCRLNMDQVPCGFVIDGDRGTWSTPEERRLKHIKMKTPTVV